ncbi:unnamed protein product, partial [Darwinula stevensoni]
AENVDEPEGWKNKDKRNALTPGVGKFKRISPKVGEVQGPGPSPSPRIPRPKKAMRDILNHTQGTPIHPSIRIQGRKGGASGIDLSSFRREASCQPKLLACSILPNNANHPPKSPMSMTLPGTTGQQPKSPASILPSCANQQHQLPISMTRPSFSLVEDGDYDAWIESQDSPTMPGVMPEEEIEELPDLNFPREELLNHGDSREEVSGSDKPLLPNPSLELSKSRHPMSCNELEGILAYADVDGEIQMSEAPPAEQKAQNTEASSSLLCPIFTFLASNLKNEKGKPSNAKCPSRKMAIVTPARQENLTSKTSSQAVEQTVASKRIIQEAEHSEVPTLKQAKISDYITNQRDASCVCQNCLQCGNAAESPRPAALVPPQQDDAEEKLTLLKEPNASSETYSVLMHDGQTALNNQTDSPSENCDSSREAPLSVLFDQWGNELPCKLNLSMSLHDASHKSGALLHSSRQNVQKGSNVVNPLENTSGASLVPMSLQNTPRCPVASNAARNVPCDMNVSMGPLVSPPPMIASNNTVSYTPTETVHKVGQVMPCTTAAIRAQVLPMRGLEADSDVKCQPELIDLSEEPEASDFGQMDIPREAHVDDLEAGIVSEAAVEHSPVAFVNPGTPAQGAVHEIKTSPPKEPLGTRLQRLYEAKESSEPKLSDEERKDMLMKVMTTLLQAIQKGPDTFDCQLQHTYLQLCNGKIKPAKASESLQNTSLDNAIDAGKVKSHDLHLSNEKGETVLAEQDVKMEYDNQTGNAENAGKKSFAAPSMAFAQSDLQSRCMKSPWKGIAASPGPGSSDLLQRVHNLSYPKYSVPPKRVVPPQRGSLINYTLGRPAELQTKPAAVFASPALPQPPAASSCLFAPLKREDSRPGLFLPPTASRRLTRDARSALMSTSVTGGSVRFLDLDAHQTQDLSQNAGQEEAVPSTSSGGIFHRSLALDDPMSAFFSLHKR